MQTKTIKQKMTSVQNIGKITKAMEMISVSKMKKSTAHRLQSQVFAERSFELLENLYTNQSIGHELLEKRESGKMLIVIIASNKGLCGGYNMNVSKQVMKFAQDHAGEAIDAIVVGKQAEKIAARNKLKVLASFNDFTDKMTSSEVRSLLHSILERYEGALDYKSVHVAYTDFVSSLSFEAKITPFIPLQVDVAAKLAGYKQGKNSKSLAQYTFEPSEQDVLNKVVPAVLTTVIYQLLLESFASEHSARVMAMRNASDNAKEMLDDLRLNYNRARQASITQEIAEIVGGSSAME